MPTGANVFYSTINGTHIGDFSPPVQNYNPYVTGYEQPWSAELLSGLVGNIHTHNLREGLGTPPSFADGLFIANFASEKSGTPFSMFVHRGSVITAVQVNTLVSSRVARAVATLFNHLYNPDNIASLEGILGVDPLGGTDGERIEAGVVFQHFLRFVGITASTAAMSSKGGPWSF